jgi:hypothetical protein
MLDKVGIDLTKGNFETIMHLFITHACTKERDTYQKGEHYEHLD